MRKNNGITLIALVITSIILLILAGVTIVQLTENGLLENVKLAKEEYLISKAKEKIQIKIMQFKTEITENQTLDEFYNYLLEDMKNNVYKVEKILIDNDNIKEIEKLNITDIEEGYTFEVDKEFNVNGPIESNLQIEATYEVISSEETQNNILISIQCSSGIQKVTYPDGNVIDGNNKTTISIDYIIENEKQYEFIIKTQNQEEKFILDTNKMNSIVISETTSYAYPILSLYGVEIGKFVNIEYAENGEKYYSLDDGVTWNQYIEDIKIINEGTIKVKNVTNENEIVQVISKYISLQLADDALRSEAYNGVDTEYVQIGKDGISEGIIFIDSTMIGKNIAITYTAYNMNNGKTVFSFYNSDNELLETKSGTSSSETVIYQVPQNASILKITKSLSYYARIYEITVSNEPIINNTTYYANITINGVESVHDMVTIDYFSTSVQRLYKIGDSDWQNYEDKPIRLELDETIYAKGIDKDGNETRIISEFTSTLPSDALGPEVYNGVDTEYVQIGKNGISEGIIFIDSTMIGKNIAITYTAYNMNNGKTVFSFYNSDNELLETNSRTSSSETVIYQVPQNASILKITKSLSYYARIYNIKR